MSGSSNQNDSRRNGPKAMEGVDPQLVQSVVRSILDERRTRHLGDTRLPAPETVDELVEMVRQLVFPGFFGRRGLTESNLPVYVEELLGRILLHTEDQVRSVLRYARDIGPEKADAPDSLDCDKRAQEIARKLIAEIPELRRMLVLDVQAAFDGDPAAVHLDEAIFCYPGVDAIFSHRLAHILLRFGVPLLPRIIQEAAHTRTGIDIHPGARIGESFFIDHGGAVVIGETAVIGNHVRIYQGVTLGALNIERDAAGKVIRSGKKRHPTIGNRVTIYAGAVILGGDTSIGDDCVIGGGVFVTESVPPGHMVRQRRPDLVLRTYRSTDQPPRQEPGPLDDDEG